MAWLSNSFGCWSLNFVLTIFASVTSKYWRRVFE